MAVIRVEKNSNYTVMSNYHMKDKQISLKAKGLLSQMLSLPEDWDYTIQGLSAINKEGVDAIRTAIYELEDNGYIQRKRIRNEKGQVKETEYVVFEKPKKPKLENPIQVDSKPKMPMLENPIQEKPTLVNPVQGNPTQLNTNISNTNLLSIESINQSTVATVEKTVEKKSDMIDLMDSYRTIIKNNIEFDLISDDKHIYKARLEEMVELMVEVMISTDQTIRIAKTNYPAQIVKDKFLKIDSMHIQYVFQCLNQNTTKVRNIKNYLLTTLFNATSTMDSYYTAEVNHDMYG